MIVAFDTYYVKAKAKTVALVFENWQNEQATTIYTEVLEDIAEYVPGQFYKRELPCILSLYKQIKEPIHTIIVDSFVYLNDAKKLGLGGHLFHELNKDIAVIGVAKTNFATIEVEKIKVFRGKSNNPLYITAAGLAKIKAADHIQEMHGPFRIPTLLRQVDALTKK